MNLLLIEDHADIAANITEFFEGRGDAVEHVADGATGLQRALADPFDAIVLDLLLPGLDGLTLCRQLRHAGRTQVPTFIDPWSPGPSPASPILVGSAVLW